MAGIFGMVFTARRSTAGSGEGRGMALTSLRGTPERTSSARADRSGQAGQGDPSDQAGRSVVASPASAFSGAAT